MYFAKDTHPVQIHRTHDIGVASGYTERLNKSYSLNRVFLGCHGHSTKLFLHKHVVVVKISPNLTVLNKLVMFRCKDKHDSRDSCFSCVLSQIRVICFSCNRSFSLLPRAQNVRNTHCCRRTHRYEII